MLLIKGICNRIFAINNDVSCTFISVLPLQWCYMSVVASQITDHSSAYVVEQFVCANIKYTKVRINGPQWKEITVDRRIRFTKGQ